VILESGNLARIFVACCLPVRISLLASNARNAVCSQSTLPLGEDLLARLFGAEVRTAASCAVSIPGASAIEESTFYTWCSAISVSPPVFRISGGLEPNFAGNDLFNLRT